jgi:hypothetical protein
MTINLVGELDRDTVFSSLTGLLIAGISFWIFLKVIGRGIDKYINSMFVADKPAPVAPAPAPDNDTFMDELWQEHLLRVRRFRDLKRRMLVFHRGR